MAVQGLSHLASGPVEFNLDIRDRMSGQLRQFRYRPSFHFKERNQHLFIGRHRPEGDLEPPVGGVDIVRISSAERLFDIDRQRSKSFPPSPGPPGKVWASV